MIHWLWKLFIRLTNPTCTINSGRIAKKTNFEKNVYIGYGTVISANKIGKHTYINDYSLIDANVVSIGRYCSIAYNTRIGLGGHPIDWVSSHPFAYRKKYGFRIDNIPFEREEFSATYIGNDVWVGANATILAGVKIGNGAIIGAHSLVTKDVEPYSIVVGTPAKHVRYRFDEDKVKKLESLEWWNWDEEKIRAKIEEFQYPEKLKT